MKHNEDLDARMTRLSRGIRYIGRAVATTLRSPVTYVVMTAALAGCNTTSEFAGKYRSEQNAGLYHRWSNTVAHPKDPTTPEPLAPSDNGAAEAAANGEFGHYRPR